MNKHTKRKKQRQESRKKVKSSELEGPIHINRRGFGYVDVPEKDEDIEIGPENLHTALNNDVVKIKTQQKRRNGRIRGEVLDIVERSKTQFVGVPEEEDGYIFIKPDDEKVYIDFILDRNTKDVPFGQKVLVEMTRWTSPDKNPLAKIIEVLGPVGTHETEMKTIVAEQGFDWHFPSSVEKEAKKIEADNEAFFTSEVEKRRDIRGVPTFTVDPDDAKDFDDAISVQTLENGNIELGVHIADVTAYVKPESAIDKEAQKRGTSIYLVDRTIPMLPEVLSNNLCSLVPETDRLAFSAIFEMSQNGIVHKRWFGETVIHSNRRFSYKEAQKILSDGQGELFAELKTADTIARALAKKRFENGSIGFETDEIKFDLDASGWPVKAYRKERLDTMKMIEDLMLLTNREVSTWMHKEQEKKKGKGIFVWRIHDTPKVDRIIELSLFLKALGYTLPHENGIVKAEDMNALFKEIEGAPEQEMIETATIKSMAKAIYSTKNIGHFGLAFNYYTHFTSPIRRYPDVMVHRLVKSQLAGKPFVGTQAYAWHTRLCAQSSEREVAAMEAERDSIKLKQVEFLSQKIGDEFEGVIVSIQDWGIFVEEHETMAEGLVRTHALKDDYYELSDHGFRLVGQKHGKTLSLGDRVRVKLIKTDVENKIIDWELLEKIED
jgi:ribonuclease R